MKLFNSRPKVLMEVLCQLIHQDDLRFSEWCENNTWQLYLWLTTFEQQHTYGGTIAPLLHHSSPGTTQGTFTTQAAFSHCHTHINTDPWCIFPAALLDAFFLTSSSQIPVSGEMCLFPLLYNKDPLKKITNICHSPTIVLYLSCCEHLNVCGDQ